jgi:hypothetical protein
VNDGAPDLTFAIARIGSLANQTFYVPLARSCATVRRFPH